LDRNLATNLKIEAWAGNDSLSGLERPSDNMARRSTSARPILVGINGAFFEGAATGDSYAGDPIGGEMIQGVITNPPIMERPVIGFGAANQPFMDVYFMNGTATFRNQTINISAINKRRLANQLILYNSYFGASTYTNEWGEEALLKPVSGNWEDLPSHLNVKCVVEKRRFYETGPVSLAIPKGSIVLSGNGNAATFVGSLAVGDEVTVSVDMSLQSDNSVKPPIRNMVGAWCQVLRNGVAVPPSSTTDALLMDRHPRTAVGFSADSTRIFFAVVEGRQPAVSQGVSIAELSEVMTYIGAANAANLDGGGSSCMVINGEIKNFLTDGSERAVSDGLAIAKE
jgi:hypothetical protein